MDPLQEKQRHQMQVAAVFEKIDTTLDMADEALADWERDDTAKRLPGLKNFVIHTRSVTNILQTLRSKVDAFDEWYGPIQLEMREDALMRYFYALRSEILKTGDHYISWQIDPRPPMAVVKLNSLAVGPPPFPGAVWKLTSEGAAWVGSGESGERRVQWTTVPESWGISRQLFSDLPSARFPEVWKEKTIAEACGAHLEKVVDIVDRAYDQFLPDAA